MFDRKYSLERFCGLDEEMPCKVSFNWTRVIAALFGEDIEALRHRDLLEKINFWEQFWEFLWSPHYLFSLFAPYCSYNVISQLPILNQGYSNYLDLHRNLVLRDLYLQSLPHDIMLAQYIEDI